VLQNVVQSALRIMLITNTISYCKICPLRVQWQIVAHEDILFVDLPCAVFANSDLRMETEYSSKTSGFTDKTTRRHSLENYNLNYGNYLSQRFLLHTVTLARHWSFIESFKIS